MHLRIRDIHPSDDYYDYRNQLIGLAGRWRKSREQITVPGSYFFRGTLILDRPIRNPVSGEATIGLNFFGVRLSIVLDNEE